MNFKCLQLPNVGVITGVLTEEQLAPLKKEILEIQSNFNIAQKRNKYLAGNIKKEFTITKSKSHIDRLLQPYILEFDKSFKYLGTMSTLDTSCPLAMGPMWVNFQEKYEFNPPHTHSGVLSFVIWISIPYSIKEEKLQSPGAESANSVAGNFAFHYTNILGKICHQSIEADNSMENHLFLFPAELNHSVTPFYTSDKYRISVSGNYTFKVPNK